MQPCHLYNSDHTLQNYLYVDFVQYIFISYTGKDLVYII